jgi:hypothetical protein
MMAVDQSHSRILYACPGSHLGAQPGVMQFDVEGVAPAGRVGGFEFAKGPRTAGLQQDHQNTVPESDPTRCLSNIVQERCLSQHQIYLSSSLQCSQHCYGMSSLNG